MCANCIEVFHSLYWNDYTIEIYYTLSWKRKIEKPTLILLHCTQAASVERFHHSSGSASA